MEKIAFKNTQVGGGANTYELMYDTPRQLIASYSQFYELKETGQFLLNITSQERILNPRMPFDIRLTSMILYFSEGNAQNMRLFIVGNSITKDFTAPIGSGTVRLTFDNDVWAEGVALRWDIVNLEITEILPLPVLRGWCLTYYIPTP
jgi:hypothetical protein